MSAFVTTRNQSYAVAATLVRGSRVRFTEDTFNGGPIAAGQFGTVQSVSNAGFNGMTAHVVLDDDGRNAFTVSCGSLAKVGR
jgi:hypothetical protein